MRIGIKGYRCPEQDQFQDEPAYPGKLVCNVRSGRSIDEGDQENAVEEGRGEYVNLGRED
jgi:hypothetical protein